MTEPPAQPPTPGGGGEGDGSDPLDIWARRIIHDPPGADTPRPELETPTDSGNALRFVRLLKDWVRYVPAEQKWLLWDDTCWRRDNTGAILEFTKRVNADVYAHAARMTDDDDRAMWTAWARASESSARRQAMLTLAAVERPLVVPAESLDQCAWLFNTANGTVNFKTRELQPHKQEDLITHCTPGGWHPEIMSSALLDDYISTFLPKKDELDYIFKVLGSTLYGNNLFRLFIIIHGGPTSGKTQLTEAIARVLGDYSAAVGTSVFRANMDDRPRPDLIRMLTSRFAYASEGSQEWELHADHVKRIVGGDPIVARGMRSDLMIERVPSFTPLIVCNEVPRINGVDAAVRNRIITLEFFRSLDRSLEDVTKKQQFMDDDETCTALLSRLIAGCIDAYTIGFGDMPQSFVEAGLNTFDALSHIGEFLEYMKNEGLLVEQYPDTCAASICWKASDLHEAYIMWVMRFGSNEDRRVRMNSRKFGAALRELGWESSKAMGVRWLGKVPGSLSN